MKEGQRESNEKVTRIEAEGIRDVYGAETLEAMSQVTTGFGRNFRHEVYRMSEEGAPMEDVQEKLEAWENFNQAREVSIDSGTAPREESRLRQTIVEGSTALLRKETPQVEPAQKLLDELKKVRGVEC